MQIQRIQTLLLLLAAIAVVVFCCTPFANHVAPDGTMTKVFMKDTPVLLTANLCIAVLLFINIFMYKNLRRQMTLTIMSALLLAGSAVACGFVVTVGEPHYHLIWFGGIVLLIVALVLAVWAWRCMRSDHRKLRSYDRLR